jgi:hypothetical protein
MKKTILTVVGAAAVTTLMLGAVYAGFFSDKAKYSGSTFNVGSADLKLLNDVSFPAEGANLVDDMPGPVIDNVSPNWWQDYPIKIMNNATTDLSLVTNANYETANDPAELRQLIYVEPFEWNDENLDGVVDEGEIGTSYGRKTIVKWKTEGYNLGTLTKGSVKGLILRFSTDSVSPAKQGTSGMFDFEFNALGM